MNHYSQAVRDALRGAVDTHAVAESWAALYPSAVKATQGENDPRVTGFLADVWQAILGAFRTLVGRMATEGWVLGQQAAQAVLDTGDVDWRGWTPGDYGAAQAVAGPGLRQLLDAAGVRIKSIAQSRVEELADVLEETLASDVTADTGAGPIPPRLSVGDLARQLEAVLDNPARAELVAWTEISRAQAEAARTVYAEGGYPEVDWVTAQDDRVCPACQAAVDSNPHPLGQPPIVPMHPRCRCAELPSSLVPAGAS